MRIEWIFPLIVFAFWVIGQAFLNDHIDYSANVFASVLQLPGKNFIGAVAFV